MKQNSTKEELFHQAKKAQSAEELRSIAKQNGIPMTEAQADAYFASMTHSDALSEDELDQVSGGGCSGGNGQHCPQCGAAVSSSNLVAPPQFSEGGLYYECPQCKTVFNIGCDPFDHKGIG